MSVNVRCLIESQHAGTTAAQMFVAIAKTIIDKFTASNSSGADATVTAYLVPAGESAVTGNCVLPAVTVEAGKSYLCGELVGHVLEVGDAIYVAAGDESSIVIRASGREVT